jgi:hypothetical protein
MEAVCPQCQARLEVPAPGTYPCTSCGSPVEVAATAADPLTEPSGAAPAAPAEEPTLIGEAPAVEVGAAAPAAWGSIAGTSMAATLQAPCAGHPGNLAERVCERCGDFMCRICTTPVEGRAYCPKCFDLLYARGSLQFAQRQFNLPIVVLGLSLCALLFASVCPVVGALISVPLAIGGLVMGTRALKEHREKPDLPHRGMTVAGLALSGIAILVALGWILFVLAMVIRR